MIACLCLTREMCTSVYESWKEILLRTVTNLDAIITEGKKNQMDCYCRLMFNQAEKLNLLTHQFCFKFTGIIIRYGSLAMEDESLFISFRNIFWKVFLFLQNFKETNIHVITTLDSFSCLLIRVTNIRNKGIIITAYSGRYYKLRPNYICI